MAKKTITEDTTITIGKSISMGHYLDFFKESTGKDLPYGEHDVWLKSQEGKTVGEAISSYRDAANLKTMEQKLSEERFDFVSESDKAFIIAFDKMLEERGYDYGGGIGNGYGWGKYMIIYGKTDTKSRPCPARIYIKEDGEIYLRLFLNKVDTHRQFIENAPAHIKNAFIFADGDCKSCNTSCAPGKVYTVDGQLMQKCNHSTFYFHAPSVDKLPDYMELYTEFNPVKKLKRTK